MNHMRVAHFMESFSPVSETFIYDYVTQLERDKIDNHVITLNRSNSVERPFGAVHVISLPTRWHPARVWSRLTKQSPFQRRTIGQGGLLPIELYVPFLRRRLKRLLKDLKPHVIHAQFGPAGFLIASVARELDIPLIVTFLGYDVSRLARDEKWVQRYRQLFEDAACLIGISNHVCAKLVAMGAPPAKVVLLHLGVALDRFSYTNPMQRFDGSCVECLHVGRLVEKKSPLDLVEAFGQAVAATRGEIDLQLRIIGDGPLREPMIERIHALDLQDQVQYLGRLPSAQISTFLRSSHIYVQHCKTADDGDQEGQGVTFVEASASGLPVVTTRHNGIPDVVIDGVTGFLVPEGDVGGMAEKIVTLARAPEVWTQFGAAGRAHVEANFALDKQGQKAIDLLERVSARQELPSTLAPGAVTI